MNAFKLLIFLLISFIYANTQRRGIALDVSSKRIGQLKYVIQVRDFRKISTNFNPDTISYYILGKRHPLLCRSNGLKDQYGCRQGELSGLQIDSVILSIYQDTITMAGLGKYPIYVEVRNRIEKICNIQNGNSNEFSEIATDTINVLDPSIFGDQQGFLFCDTPVIYADDNDSLEFLPKYSNFIGDSIIYNITTPLGRINSNPIDKTPNYQFPDQYLPSPNNQFTINSKTGKLKWKTPAICPCNINVTVNGIEYQKGIKISSFTRDMMVIFRNCAAKSNISNDADNPKIEIFPNPVSDQLNITTDIFGKKEMHLFDMLNRLVSKITFFDRNFIINISELNSTQPIFYLLYNDQKQVLKKGIIEIK